MTTAGQRSIRAGMLKRTSSLSSSGDAVNVLALVGEMWIHLAPSNTSRLLLADTVLRERTQVVAIALAQQNFDIPAAGDVLVLESGARYLVEGSFDVDSLHHEWHIALSHFKPDLDEAPEEIGNVIEDYVWRAEYWAADADANGLLVARTPTFPDLQAAASIDVGVSTLGLDPRGLPDALVDQAFQPVNSQGPFTLVATPEWGESRGFEHWRAILYLNEVPANDVQWQTQGTPVPPSNVLCRSLLGLLQATLTEVTANSFNLPAHQGWALCDFIAGPGYFRWRVNGVEFGRDSGPERFSFDHFDIAMGCARNGVALDPGTRFLFWGFRTLEADPGFQEHVDDWARLQEPSIFERYPWQVAYSCEDVEADGSWLSEAGDLQLDTDGNAPVLNINTDGLRPFGIGASRVNKAAGVPSARGWAASGWSTDITGPWHLRLFARIRHKPTQWIHQYRLDPNQVRWSQPSAAYLVQVANVGGTTTPPNTVAPDGEWVLVDWVHDGVETLFMVNGVQAVGPTIGAPDTMRWDGPAPFALGDNTGLTAPTDMDVLFYGLRPIPNRNAFPFEQHLRDAEDAGVI